MPHPLEYHIYVRRLFPPTVPLLSLAAASLFFASFADAQINGVPASVTSPGFGGRAVNGPPASVTSLGPRGYAPPLNGNRNGVIHHRRNHERDFYSGPYLYAYPVPYAVDPNYAMDDPDVGNDAPDQGDYQGGPTVFDRRGSGARSYIPPVEDAPAPHAVDKTENFPADAEPALPPTLLIFKDGRKLEIGNYAILGVTLFDLTPGHARKIALADLDLEATRKQNDDRGLVFQVPPSIQGN